MNRLGAMPGKIDMDRPLATLLDGLLTSMVLTLLSCRCCIGDLP